LPSNYHIYNIIFKII